jgi:hypothetical protein
MLRLISEKKKYKKKKTKKKKGLPEARERAGTFFILCVQEMRYKGQYVRNIISINAQNSLLQRAR